MRDYAETVQAMRYAFEQPCYDCVLGEKCNWGDFCFFKRAADAIEELLAKDTNVPNKWISVEERLPEDFQKVLVFWWEHSEPMVDTAFWQKDAKRFDGEHWVRMEDKVTHWMPLPAPPEEPKEGHDGK